MIFASCQLALPPYGTGFSFEWSDNIAGNPTAVEIAGLGLDSFSVDVTGVHQAGIISNISLE
jgi:hypothetical protein